MIEVQLKDNSFIYINPDMIISMKANATKEIQDMNGNTYTVNDAIKADTFTIEMVGGKTYELTKLGVNILRKRMSRADFNPEYYYNGIHHM